MIAVCETFSEFDRVANLLRMPESERLGILNVSAETYAGLRVGNPAALNAVQPETERRVSYALPLMRRLASNSPVVALPTCQPTAKRAARQAA